VQAREVHALYRRSGDRRGFGAFVRGVQPVGEELDSLAGCAAVTAAQLGGLVV
jgi:hypothetical protein